MRLIEAKRKYRNQWIAFQYTDKARSIGKVVCRDKSRDGLHEKLMARKKIKRFTGEYLTYTGPKPLLPKGWGVLLCSS